VFGYECASCLVVRGAIQKVKHRHDFNRAVGSTEIE
jgi:hypothetical protein